MQFKKASAKISLPDSNCIVHGMKEDKMPKISFKQFIENSCNNAELKACIIPLAANAY
jgi:hypothetical protein